jgi:hypothetical protein
MHCVFSWRLLDPKEKLSAGGWVWVWCPGGDMYMGHDFFCLHVHSGQVMSQIHVGVVFRRRPLCMRKQKKSFTHVSLSLCLFASLSLCLSVSLCAGGDGSVCKRKESCDTIQRRLLNRHLRLEREGAD